MIKNILWGVLAAVVVIACFSLAVIVCVPKMIESKCKAIPSAVGLVNALKGYIK